MPYGDPESCRLEIRHADGRVDVRAWQEVWDWPPQLGQLIHEGGAGYRIASITRDGPTTLVVVLPAQRSARRLPS